MNKEGVYIGEHQGDRPRVWKVLEGQLAPHIFYPTQVWVIPLIWSKNDKVNLLSTFDRPIRSLQLATVEELWHIPDTFVASR